MSDEDLLWYVPEIFVPTPSKVKEKTEKVEKTINDYMGEDNEQNLGDC
tara:strand:- start:126 stop:269 length:144 start_codon:yes stop_codon:yes gene_type:complete